MAKLTDEEKKERIKIRQREWYRNNKDKWKVYQQKNKAARRNQRKEHYKNNAEELKAKAKKYQDSLDKERKKELSKNRLMWTHNNLERQKATNKRYRLKYPERYRVHCLKRKARKLNATPSWLIDCEVERKRLHQIYLLSRLLKKADGILRHVDHMWPLSDGGPHWSGNLQILTATENLKKHAKVCPIIKKQIQLNLEEERLNGNTN